MNLTISAVNMELQMFTQGDPSTWKKRVYKTSHQEIGSPGLVPFVPVPFNDHRYPRPLLRLQARRSSNSRYTVTSFTSEEIKWDFALGIV